MGHVISGIKAVRREPRPLLDDFFQRLINFYRRQPPPRLSPIWEGVLSTHQNPLISALHYGDIGLVRSVLENVYIGNIMGGLDFASGEGDFLVAFRDAAVALGNTIGSVPLFEPRQPAPLNIDVGNLVMGAESVLGFEINHPGGGRMLGAEIASRFIPYKLLDVINVTLALPNQDWVHRSILEIGSGSAFLAYVAAVMSGWELAGYDSIDLPSTSVIGAYISAGIFGPNSIWLSGEPVEGLSPIRFLGTGVRDVLQYGLVVNQDSLPEMPHQTALDYVEMIGNQLYSGGYFMSVNHESSLGGQHRVFDMVKEKTDLKQISRSLFFSRPGYIQEVWQKA